LLLGIEYNLPSAISIAIPGSSSTWFSQTNGVVSSLPALTTQYNSGMFEIVAEYEYSTNAQNVLFVGHSLVDAYSPDMENGTFGGQHTGYPQQWARKHNACAMVNAYTGAKLTDFTDAGSIKWQRMPSITPDYIVLDLTANDVNAQVPLATIQTNYATVVTNLQTKYPGIPIFSVNDPALDATGAIETLRQSVNAWLVSAPHTHGYMDIDSPLTDPNNTGHIYAKYAASDNFPPNVRGHAVIADTIVLPV